MLYVWRLSFKETLLNSARVRSFESLNFSYLRFVFDLGELENMQIRAKLQSFLL